MSVFLIEFEIDYVVLSSCGPILCISEWTMCLCCGFVLMTDEFWFGVV